MKKRRFLKFVLFFYLLLFWAGCVTAPIISPTPTPTGQVRDIDPAASLELTETETPAEVAPEAVETETPAVDLSSTPPMIEGGVISLLSFSLSGNPTPGATIQLSGDGRYAVYLSDYQVYLRDWETGELILVSTSPDHTPADGWSFAPTISEDGKTVVFFSFASNLTEDPFKECPPEIGNECGSLYIYDVVSQKIERVGVAAGQSSALDTAVSADGAWIAFAVPWAFYREGVYLYHRITDTLIEIAAGDVSDPSLSAPVGGTTVDISANGRFVAFASPDDGLVSKDANGVSDVFVFDRDTGEIERITNAESSNGESQPSGFQWVPNTGGGTESGLSISADGRYIVFMSASADLAQALSPCPHWPGTPVFPACRHIYLFDRVTGKTELISISSDGSLGNRASQDGDISADGRWVIFTSLSNNLTEDGPIRCRDFSFDGYCPQVFVRDRENKQTYLLSIGWDNRPANALSSFPVISTDGQFISFVSGAGNLSAAFSPSENQYAWYANLAKLLDAITN